eukprot:c6390_g1_i1.p1 GENE.c6390_g1_i1~~c6390_g1_i1.p1  ORF type:complete len:234 (+),score=33.02 c6390_g1_i1:52-753(+)
MGLTAISVIGAASWAGFFILNKFIFGVFGAMPSIPAKGSSLEQLTSTDKAVIFFNRFAAIAYIYHLYQLCLYSPHIKWELDQLTFGNTIGALVLFFVLYDFIYTLFHRSLHHRAIYHLIHKHHHRQAVPARGHEDAFNTHPIEFVLGEYLHVLCVWIAPSFHVIAVVAMVLLTGFLATINHTRLDLKFPSRFPVFAVAYHDIHHHLVTKNYGQYIMLWDVIFQSFKSPFVNVK